eukprot:scaffold2350_cov259-Pinguiococcus_pyrenoidosus.AAC.1
MKRASRRRQKILGRFKRYGRAVLGRMRRGHHRGDHGDDRDELGDAALHGDRLEVQSHLADGISADLLRRFTLRRHRG